MREHFEQLFFFFLCSHFVCCDVDGNFSNYFRLMNSQWAFLEKGISTSNKVVSRLRYFLENELRKEIVSTMVKKRNFAFFSFFSLRSINSLLHFFTIGAANEPEQFRNFYSKRWIKKWRKKNCWNFQHFSAKRQSTVRPSTTMK